MAEAWPSEVLSTRSSQAVLWHPRGHSCPCHPLLCPGNWISLSLSQQRISFQLTQLNPVFPSKVDSGINEFLFILKGNIWEILFFFPFIHRLFSTSLACCDPLFSMLALKYKKSRLVVQAAAPFLGTNLWSLVDLKQCWRTGVTAALGVISTSKEKHRQTDSFLSTLD